MRCGRNKLNDFVKQHDLEKYYANNPIVSKYLTQPSKKQCKKKKVCTILAISGLAIVGCCVAYYFLKSREDFYGDDFFFDEDEDLFFDDEDFDDLEETLDEIDELEEDLVALEEDFEEDFEENLES